MCVLVKGERLRGRIGRAVGEPLANVEAFSVVSGAVTRRVGLGREEDCSISIKAAWMSSTQVVGLEVSISGDADIAEPTLMGVASMCGGILSGAARERE